MAQLQTLQTRVENTNKKLQKLMEKKERIIVALNGGKNPYGYEERDLRCVEYDLADFTKKLATYTKDLNEALVKESQPKVKALVEFLAQWKQKATIYYNQECEAYAILCKDLHKEYELLQYDNTIEWSQKSKMLREQSKDHRLQKERFTVAVRNLTDHVNKCAKPNELEKMLDKEVENKYKDLVARIQETVGTLEDAKGLYVGNNGSINGYVVGDKGKANVETIYAGGYNIQCLHYRVLVKAIKGAK